MEARPGLEALFVSAVREVIDAEDEEADDDPVEMLLPFLKSYGLVNRTASAREVHDHELKELALRWQLKTKDPKTLKERKREDLVTLLIETALAKSRVANAGYTGGTTAPVLTQPGGKVGTGGKKIGAALETSQSLDALFLKPKKKKKIKNYFGLPDYAYASSSGALVYKARKNAEVEDEETMHNQKLARLAAMIDGGGAAGAATPSVAAVQQKADARAAHHKQQEDAKAREAQKSGSKNVAAQRKVAEALVTMARNETMAKHFMHKGGAEAVLKLIGDSADKLVLTNCVACLLEVSHKAEYCKVLADKYVMGTLQTLVEKSDHELRLRCMQVLANLTYQSHLCALLVMGGAIPLVQLVLATVGDHECVCFCMLCISNIAPILENLPDLELVVKICVQASKQLDIKENFSNALFAVDIFVNFSRCYQYGGLLCEEGVLALLMAMLETHMTPEMIALVSEGLVNLSTTRKNRREISACGIGLFLDQVFRLGAPDNRADILSMIGNLLTSGFFHDKMAREETVSIMLGSMLDPQQVRQFISVSYVISQMAQHDASATVLVSCGLVKIALDLLSVTPAEARENMWTVLVALSQQPKFFERMVAERALVQEMYKEVVEGGSKQIDLVAQLAFNLSLRADLCDFLAQDLAEMFVDMLKQLFGNYGMAVKVRTACCVVPPFNIFPSLFSPFV